MKIIDCIQNSPEWFAARLGKVTGSRISEALAQNRKKTGPGVTSKKYMRKLIAERMSQEPQESYRDDTMDRGTETEPQAREYYEKLNKLSVLQVGFVERDEDVGCSPDGLVGDNGMLEIKCPNSSTHIEYIIDDRLPPAYEPQVQSQLWICEREWCDFVSFDPRLSQRPYFCKRIYRDEEYIKELSIKIRMFTTEMKVIMEKLTASPF